MATKTQKTTETVQMGVAKLLTVAFAVAALGYGMYCYAHYPDRMVYDELNRKFIPQSVMDEKDRKLKEYYENRYGQ